VRNGRSVSADEGKNCSEKQKETDCVQGKCCYEILGRKPRDEGPEESNCW
jgi:hypothetical protein